MIVKSGLCETYLTFFAISLVPWYKIFPVTRPSVREYKALGKSSIFACTTRCNAQPNLFDVNTNAKYERIFPFPFLKNDEMNNVAVFMLRVFIGDPLHDLEMKNIPNFFA